MNRNRELKQQVVQSVQQILADNEIIMIMYNKGLTVEKVKELRRKTKLSNSQYFVAKNTLVKLALKESKFKELDNLIVGPVSVLSSNTPLEIAKVIYEFTKNNPELEICGGMMNGDLLDHDAIKNLATMPTHDELRAKIIGLIKAPATKIARVLKLYSDKAPESDANLENNNQ